MTSPCLLGPRFFEALWSPATCRKGLTSCLSCMWFFLGFRQVWYLSVWRPNHCLLPCSGKLNLKKKSIQICIVIWCPICWTSWLSCKWCFLVVSSLSQMAFWVRCGIWVYGFLIFAFLTLSQKFCDVIFAGAKRTDSLQHPKHVFNWWIKHNANLAQKCPYLHLWGYHWTFH